jgi:hypothetical protein
MPGIPSTLHSPTCPIGLQSDCSESESIRVESEWSPSGPIYSMLFKQFCKLLLCCDISPIGLHSDWIGTYNLLLKLVSENVKAQFWQALNPHPLH